MEEEGGKGMREVKAVRVMCDVLGEIFGHVSERGAALRQRPGDVIVSVKYLTGARDQIGERVSQEKEK